MQSLQNTTPTAITRRIGIALTIFMAALLMSTAPGFAAPKRSADWYIKHGVSIASPTNSAPISFLGMNGQPKGVLIDVWVKWSEKTGIPVRFRFERWAKTLELVANGECDFHGGLFINDERITYLDFSTPLHELESALIVSRKNDTDVQTIYNNYTIGVLDKGHTEYFLRTNKKNLKIIKFPTDGDVAQALFLGQIQAAAGDHPILGYEIGKKGKGHELVVKEILFKHSLHAAVAKGNSTLLALIDEGLSNITPAEYKNITNHWFVFHAENIDWFQYGFIAVTILFIATMIAIFIGRSKAGLYSEE
nr:transporter substrate-binding domain-containing protein [uncultured Pseudodesulfovibrio sp.]